MTSNQTAPTAFASSAGLPGAEGPAIHVRRSAERGGASHGWLETRHTFSFGQYHDARHMGFGPLRVINEDIVAPGTGFGMHAHHDMEILSFVVSGQLQHKDSMGNTAVIGPGEVQRITAGRGIRHSETNPSGTEPVHFLQVWIEPSERGVTPSYDERRFGAEARDHRWALVASRDGGAGSIAIQQDARVLRGTVREGRPLSLSVGPGRRVWLQVIEGSVRVLGELLARGDGAAITGPASGEGAAEWNVTLEGLKDADVLVFDLP
jgi:hypothetical protein